MRDFVNAWADLILERETDRLDKIMAEIAKKIQGDVIAVTYSVIDAFYQDYMPEDGRIYIRTEELSKRHRDSKGKFTKKPKNALKRGTDRYSDVGLRETIKALTEGNTPALGVCQKMEGILGYQAGVLFDESKFENMKHSVKGKNFTEWDIVEDFLWGVHGNESIAVTTPSAGQVLYDYIHSYKPRFDQHYRNACRKYKNK